jgi:hypothetical protein
MSLFDVINRRFYWSLSFIILCLWGAWSPAWSAGGLVIGPFCIEGVALTPDDNARTYVANGYWTPVRLQYDARNGASPSAQVALFDSFLPITKALYTCVELQRMYSTRKVILSGTISKLSISASVFTATGPSTDNAVQIEPSKFQLEIAKASAGQLQLAGGTVRLTGKPLKITNTDTLFANPSTLVGLLNVATADLAMTGAKFVIGGGQLSADMKTGEQKNQEIRLNLATKAAVLWNGAFDADGPTKLQGLAFNFAGLSFTKAAISSKQLHVSTTNGVASAKFVGATGQADDLAMNGTNIITTLHAPTFSFESMNGSILQAADNWTVESLKISNATFISSDAKVSNAAGSELLQGSLKAQFQTWSISLVDGTTSWSGIKAAAINFWAPAGALAQVTINLKGPLANPLMSGSLNLANMTFGKLTIKRAIAFSFNNISTNNVLHVPIHFNLPSRSGTVTFADADQQIQLTAGLSHASLDADLQIDLSAPANSSLNVPTGKLQLGLFSTVATRPFLAGTTPAFGDADLTATNSSDLKIAVASTGQIVLAVKLLTLGQPIIRIGRKGTTARAAITLNSKGDVTLTYDLGVGAATILTGDFAAQDSGLQMLDPGAEIDLSGVLVRDPYLHFASLNISFVKAGAVQAGTGAIRQLTASGSLIHKPSDPDHPTEISFSGNFQRPLSADAIDAVSVKMGKTLEFDLLDVRKLDLALNGVAANFSGGVKLSDASFSLSAADFQTLKFNDVEVQKYSAAHLSASGKIDPGNGIHVEGDVPASVDVVVDGFSDHLNGAGSVHIDGFAGSVQSNLKIAFSCKGSDHLNVPIEYNFADIGGVSAQAKYNDGHIEAEGDLGSIVLLVHTKSGNDCNTDVKKYMISSKGKYWTWGICNSGPFNWYRCKWESPEVSFLYHYKLAIRLGGGTITLTNPHIRITGRGLNICNPGAVTSVLKEVGGVVPQIDTTSNFLVGPARDILNASLDVTFETGETMVANTIQDQASWLVSSTGTVLGNALCFF